MQRLGGSSPNLQHDTVAQQQLNSTGAFIAEGKWLWSHGNGMSEPQLPKPDRHADSERDRRIGNAVILAFFLVVVGIGVWLANAMIDYRRIDDCLAQGRRNCAPVEAPMR
jgi:hypothetical protein